LHIIYLDKAVKMADVRATLTAQASKQLYSTRKESQSLMLSPIIRVHRNVVGTWISFGKQGRM